MRAACVQCTHMTLAAQQPERVSVLNLTEATMPFDSRNSGQHNSALSRRPPSMLGGRPEDPSMGQPSDMMSIGSDAAAAWPLHAGVASAAGAVKR